MLDDHGFEIFEQNAFPLAYLLTIRTFGTWLHGDQRGSYGRIRDARTNSKFIAPNPAMHAAMVEERRQPAFLFGRQQRVVVQAAMIEVAKYRRYTLNAQNVRKNHAHVVIGAAVNRDKIVNELKSYATRRLREEDLIERDVRIWSRGASTRYLWKPRHVEAAVDYVLYCQEDIPFDFRD